MLYRNPEVPARVSFFASTFRAVASLRVARRRRQTELDVLAMNGHLKRDLGLDTYTVLGR